MNALFCNLKNVSADFNKHFNNSIINKRIMREERDFYEPITNYESFILGVLNYKIFYQK
jgi:hypothetical protein